MSQSVPTQLVPVSGNQLVAVDDGGHLALIARQTRWGDRGSLHVVVLRADALPLVLVEVALPLRNDRWEYRTSGLWVEAVCEDPGVHWSYGLEAFALAIDRPDELVAKGYGYRTPLGWELDFVRTADPAETSVGQGGGGLASVGETDPVIEVGQVDGLVLMAPAEGGERPFTGEGWRASWTSLSPDPWPVSLPAPSSQPLEVALPLDGVGEVGPIWWVGHDGRELTSRWSSA